MALTAITFEYACSSEMHLILSVRATTYTGAPFSAIDRTIGGHRPPQRFSTTTGPILRSSNGFRRRSPVHRTILWRAYQHCVFRYAVVTQELITPSAIASANNAPQLKICNFPGNISGVGSSADQKRNFKDCPSQWTY